MAKLFDFQWQISVPESLLHGDRFDRWEEVSPVLPTVQGGPKKLYVLQHVISLEPFEIKLSGFHQSIHRISADKDKVVIFM